MQVSDLWGKLFRSCKQRQVDAYRAMVDATLIDGLVVAEERRLLASFRARHAISDAEHDEVLASFGWSAADFERGHKPPQRAAPDTRA